MLLIMCRPKVSIFVWVWVVSVLLFQAPLGSDTLCRHNFEHNTMDGASSIMPA